MLFLLIIIFLINLTVILHGIDQSAIKNRHLSFYGLCKKLFKLSYPSIDGNYDNKGINFIINDIINQLSTHDIRMQSDEHK
jgi:hypothetical protein